MDLDDGRASMIIHGPLVPFDAPVGARFRTGGERMPARAGVTDGEPTEIALATMSLETHLMDLANAAFIMAGPLPPPSSRLFVVGDLAGQQPASFL